MLRDMGFAHAIAKAVLEDDPANGYALRELRQPENKIVYDDGTIVDLSCCQLRDAIREGLQRQVARLEVKYEN